MNFKKQYDAYLALVESGLKDAINNLKCNTTLKSSIEYSVMAGGKRIRSVMFLAMLDALRCDYRQYIHFAVALEFIHTYSLIHDDLPAMDNDDFRRGRASNHKVFGDGMAILAGDALLNYAFELCLDCIKNNNEYLALKTLANCSGVHGMINGQAYDLCAEGNVNCDQRVNDIHLLKLIHENKTGRLLTAPIVMAFQIAGNANIELAKELGYYTGQLFQITDDLLDCVGEFEKMGKTLGKDKACGKLTAVSVYGVSECANIINNTYDEIVKILKKLDNISFFEDFYISLKQRIN